MFDGGLRAAILVYISLHTQRMIAGMIDTSPGTGTLFMLLRQPEAGHANNDLVWLHRLRRLHSLRMCSVFMCLTVCFSSCRLLQ